jgi:glycosyltransferase involved in cell wall biosynthesis
MLAPISWPLPPAGYGPWERVVFDLTEELVRRGHDVTLFAAAGSRSSARLVETCPYPLELWPEIERRRPAGLDPESGLREGPPDPRVWEELHIARCMERAAAGEFDIVHSHLHVHALPFARLLPCPLVTTLHGSAWVRAVHPMLREFREQPFVSLSEAERSFLPELRYVATVPNGIRLEDFPFEPHKEDYLLFAGRLAPEKGPAEAIEVARRSGRRLLLAGEVEEQYRGYFEERIRPHLEPGRIEYLGPQDRTELARLYRRAAAVLFLPAWREPFGLVAVEALASGTPVIATRIGALPEILQEGRTGFLVDSPEEAARAVEELGRIDPAACRSDVQRRFSAAAMAEGYERVYRRLIEEGVPLPDRPARAVPSTPSPRIGRDPPPPSRS